MAILDILHYPDNIGLAATQVNVHQQVIVIDISEDKDQPLCLINPSIIDEEGTESCDEGCLSVPDIYETVQRSEKITVKALDQNGDEYTLQADEMLAVCIQHEIDHLKGKLFVDYLSPLKQQRIKKRLQKQQREDLRRAVL